MLACAITASVVPILLGFLIGAGVHAALHLRRLDRRLPTSPRGSAIVTWMLLVVAHLFIALVVMLAFWLLVAMAMLEPSSASVRIVYGIGGAIALAHAAVNARGFAALGVHTRAARYAQRYEAARRRTAQSVVVLACALAFFHLPSILPIGGRWGEMAMLIALVCPLAAAGAMMLVASFPLLHRRS